MLSSMSILTYRDVSQDQVSQWTSKLAADPAFSVHQLAPDTFQIQAHGFTVHADFEPVSKVLTVDANFLIKEKVDAAIKQALGRV